MKGTLLGLFLLPSVLTAQKIKVSEFDKFSKKYRIETSVANIQMGFTDVLNLSFRSVDKTIFLVVDGAGKTTGLIGENDVIIFLLSNDSTIEAKSTGLQDYKASRNASNYHHEYYISEDAVRQLERSTVKGVRVYSNRSYADTNIKQGKAKNINEICRIFLQEFDNKITTTAK